MSLLTKGAEFAPPLATLCAASSITTSACFNHQGCGAAEVQPVKPASQRAGRWARQGRQARKEARKEADRQAGRRAQVLLICIRVAIDCRRGLSTKTCASILQITGTCGGQNRLWPSTPDPIFACQFISDDPRNLSRRSTLLVDASP